MELDWKEENWTRLKKALYKQSKKKVDRVWYEGGLDLCEDAVPQMIVLNFLRSTGKNPITYENAFTLRKCNLIS